MSESTIDVGIPEHPRTLAEKVWDDHLVVKGENGQPDLIYIDLHLVHEVTSPQAFDGLRAEGRPVHRLDLTIATENHNTPTLDIDKPIADLEWLGLFSDDPLPAGKNTPIDILTERMLSLMSYKPGERDMLIMQHEIVAEYKDHKEAITATMIDYGIPHGDSSMSRTVGLPAAVATGLILNGELNLTGVHTPVIPEIYEPVLAKLGELGIGLTEKWEVMS